MSSSSCLGDGLSLGKSMEECDNRSNWHGAPTVHVVPRPARHPLIANTPKKEIRDDAVRLGRNVSVTAGDSRKRGADFLRRERLVFDWRKSGLALATLRPDGWAGFEPEDSTKRAVVTTTPIIPAAASPRDGGRSSRRLAEGDCAGYKGKPLGTSQTITRTGSDAVVIGTGIFCYEHQGKSVRLKFEFAKAKLYSFSFGN